MTRETFKVKSISSKTASQISRSVIDVTLSLKSETNTVTISQIVSRKGSLNNKTQEIYNRLINICDERDITFVDHTDGIDTEGHLNQSKVHLNKSEIIEYGKNVCEYLLLQDWYSADNTGNIALESEKRSIVLGVNNYLSVAFITRLLNQILFVTLVINLYWRIQFLKNQMKFHQILIGKVSLIRIKFWKIYVIKTSIGCSLHNLTL